MIKKLATVAALAAAVLLAPAAQIPAHALPGLGKAVTPANGVIHIRRGGSFGGVHINRGLGHFRGGGVRLRGPYVGGFYAGGLNFRRPGFRGRHFYGRRAFAYAPLRHRRAFYGYSPYVYGGGAYYGGCYWLKARALETGDPYWWRRYEDCID